MSPLHITGCMQLKLENVATVASHILLFLFDPLGLRSPLRLQFGNGAPQQLSAGGLWDGIDEAE
eukprot:811011-Pleurochrysis_carterae.AAC.1